MGLLADILIIVAALASLILVLRWRRSKRLERLLTLLVAMIGLAVPTLDLIFRDDIQKAINDRVDPLEAKIAERADSTDRLFEVIDSTNQRLACRMDSLETLIISISGQEEPDSSHKALAYEQAECLEGIVKTALDRGKVAIGLGKYDEALTHLGYAMEAAQEDLEQRAEIFFYKGIVYHLQGMDTLEFDCFDSCVTYSPQSSEAWYNRGIALDDLCRYDEAIASFDSALTYKPDDHEAWYNRGMALDELGRYEEAIASYDSSLVYRSDKHNVWCNRGIALGKLDRDVEAITSFDSALVYKPDKHVAWYNRGISLRKLDLLVEAIASYDSALTYRPDYHHAWNNRAIALALLNRFEEALRSCDSALKYAPGDSLTIAAKQWIIERMNE